MEAQPVAIGDEEQVSIAYPGTAFYPRTVAFGSFPEKNSKFFSRGQRQRIDIIAAFQCLVIPWVVFCLTYAGMSFKLHFTNPWLVYGLVGAGYVLAAFCGFLALNSVLKKVLHKQVSEPNWLVFLFCTTLIGLLLGTILGNLNFWTNMQPYYNYQGMNTYQGVDPAQNMGQQLMDAGKVNFVNSSSLDLARAMGFKDGLTYCVAPITQVEAGLPPAPLAQYDFWAVGIGCCSANTADFHCGAYKNPNAHGGLRLLGDDQRAFFRLAVQQAEATYALKAVHPLFFYWVEDVTSAMNSFRDEGYKFYLIGMMVHFGFQLLVVALAVSAFAKIGHF